MAASRRDSLAFWKDVRKSLLNETYLPKTSPYDFLLACHQGKLSVVRTYTSQGQDVRVRSEGPRSLHATGLHFAAQQGHFEIVRHIVSASNTAEVLNARMDNGATPLSLAVQHHRHDVVVFLLEHGANPDIALSGKDTPLCVAVRVNNIPAIPALLAHGADPSLGNEQGYTPMMMADILHHDEAKQALVKPDEPVISREASASRCVLA